MPSTDSNPPSEKETLMGILTRLRTLTALLLLAAAPAVQAQFAVIDVASVTQLVTQAQTLEQQLTQAQQQFQSLTGDRGMELLLSGVTRNYLPADWAALQSAAQGGGSLGAAVRAALDAESLLSAAQLALLPPALAQQLRAQRNAAALLQGMTQQALGNASARFASLQQLISAVGRAPDAKAALDLQARVAAEQAMLQNESSKLQVLFQTVRAAEQANAEHARELTAASHGQFATRFTPRP
jgi:type IV secretion system protein VirB5